MCCLPRRIGSVLHAARISYGADLDYASVEGSDCIRAVAAENLAVPFRPSQDRLPGAAANSDIRRCCLVTPMDLQGRPRRPAISLGAGAPHEHCPLSVAQAVGAKKALDGLLVVDDSKCARPVRASQA